MLNGGRSWDLIIIILVLLAAAGLTVMIIEPRSSVPIEITPGNTGRKNKIGIYGAVKTPGIYEYEGYIRVTNEADPAYANLTGWVVDGETILIPTSGIPEPTLTIQVPDDKKVNLNTADKNELMSLPGIGEKRAGEIIKFRENKGKITSKEDLLEIQGISEKLLENIYDRLIVD